MKCKCLLAGLIFLYANIDLVAQSSKQKGLAILNNGDVVNGWINYKSKERSPKQINFYTDSLSKHATVYNIADIKSFEIAGGDAFIKATVGKDVPMQDVVPNSSLLRDTTLMQSVFVRVVLIGKKISLYEWNEDRVHYYLKENDGEYQELKLKMMNDGNPDMKLYKNLLTYLTTKYSTEKDISSDIESTNYTEDDLKKIVVKLNGENNVVRNNARHYHTHLSLFAGGGASFSSMKLSGNKAYIGNLVFKPSSAPYFMVGMELTGFGIDRLGFRMELSYSSAKYSGKGESVTSSNNQMSYDLEQKTISPILSANYNIVQQKNFKIYFGVGAAYNFSSYSKNVWHQTFPELTQTNYAVLKNGYIAGNLKVGVIVAKKFEMSAGRLFWDDFIFKSTSYSMDHATYNVWVGYRLK